MKSEILKFFNSISEVGSKLKERLNYVVIVPTGSGVFVATNLSDEIIDKLPIDEIADTMKDAAIKQTVKVTTEGVRH